jgi:hypothetical protein
MSPLLLLVGVLALLWLLGTWLARHIQGLILLLTGSVRIATISYDALVLPGVMLHELSHALVALLLGVRVLRVNLFQFRNLYDPRQGEVIVARADPLRMSLIGAAPLFGGLAVLTLLVRSLLPETAALGALTLVHLGPLLGNWRALLVLYLLFAIANTMFPSEADRQAWWTVGAVTIGVSLLLWLLGVQPELPPAWLVTLTSYADRLVAALVPVIIVDVVVLAVVLILESLVSRVRGRRVIYRI